MGNAQSVTVEEPSQEVFDKLKSLVRSNDVKSLENILEKNPNFANAKNSQDYNDSILMVALETGNYDIIKLLITYGANVNYKNKKNETSLYFYSLMHEPNIDIVILLLNQSSDVNYSVNNVSILQNFVKYGRYDVVNMLINEYNANYKLYRNDHEGKNINIILDTLYHGSDLTTQDKVKLFNLLIVEKGVTDDYIFDYTSFMFKNEQLEFLNSLNTYEKKLLTMYSRKGDVILNGILRTNVNNTIPFDPSFLKKIQEFINEYQLSSSSNVLNSENNIGIVRSFVVKFLDFFKNKVPSLRYPIKVYRGITHEKYIPKNDNQFLSTSFSTKVATDYITHNHTNNNKCCFLEIIVNPGVKAVYFVPLSKYPNEEEVLIGPPFRTQIGRESVHVEHIFSYNNVYEKFEISIHPIDKYRKAGKRKTYRKKNRKVTKKNYFLP